MRKQWFLPAVTVAWPSGSIYIRVNNTGYFIKPTKDLWNSYSMPWLFLPNHLSQKRSFLPESENSEKKSLQKWIFLRACHIYILFFLSALKYYKLVTKAVVFYKLLFFAIVTYAKKPSKNTSKKLIHLCTNWHISTFLACFLTFYLTYKNIILFPDYRITGFLIIFIVYSQSAKVI